MYLIVVAVLSLALAFSAPLYHWITVPGQVLAFLALVTTLPAGLAALGTRRVLRRLDTDPSDPGHAHELLSRISMLCAGLIAAGHATLLLCTNWLVMCDQLPVVGRWPVVPTVVAIFPFIISILLVWVATYPADHALRHIAFEAYTLRGRPARPAWPLLRHLAYNLRHQVLFVLLPLLLILAARDLIHIYEDRVVDATHNRFAPDLLLGLCALAVAVVAPAILRRIWSTRPLPAGPLRDRLLILCERLRMRCREILVWRSSGMVVNAAVMGIVAPLRYVLITDAMLEQMDDTKIEAVFGHEAGHVKQHHILFFLLFAFVTGCLVTVLSVRDPHLERAALVGAILLAKWGLLFGWISRRFERQADIFGARTLVLAGVPCQQPCAVHGSGDSVRTDSNTQKHALCSTAAEIFSDTLNQVALLNGIRPEAPSWRHSSISSRAQHLLKLAGSPAAAARFERSLGLIKAAILAAAVVSGLWAAWEIQIWTIFAGWSANGQ